MMDEKFSEVEHKNEAYLLELDTLEKKQLRNLFIKNLEN